MIRNIIFIFLFINSFVYGQKNDLQIKLNMLTAPLAITNIGVEYALSDNITIQGDGLISPWRSFAGNHLQMYIGFVEGRYYFNQAFSKFYIGPNIGVGFFDLQKWNYWDTDKYQRGVSILTGITIGYQAKLSDRFGLDISLGGGHSQGNYHGYKEGEGRYDKAENFNKSGEWIIYKGGLMLTYKLKRPTF